MSDEVDCDGQSVIADTATPCSGRALLGCFSLQASVSKHTTSRTPRALEADDLELNHLNVTTAFLNGELEEVTCTQQPEGGC